MFGFCVHISTFWYSSSSSILISPQLFLCSSHIFILYTVIYRSSPLFPGSFLFCANRNNLGNAAYIPIGRQRKRQLGAFSDFFIVLTVCVYPFSFFVTFFLVPLTTVEQIKGEKGAKPCVYFCCMHIRSTIWIRRDLTAVFNTWQSKNIECCLHSRAAWQRTTVLAFFTDKIRGLFFWLWNKG